MDTRDLSPDTTTEESSFEIDESFHAMIERKRKEQLESKTNSVFSEDISAISRSVDECSEDVRSRGNDSTFIEQESIHKTTDESFEEMERICSMNQSKLSTSERPIEEESDLSFIGSGATNRLEGLPLTDGSCLQKTAPIQNRDHKSINLADMTQLDEVEEPSYLWENSVQHGPGKGISPVKRVHMLRPSTILEEGSINETASNTTPKNTSLDSYVTAKQNLNMSDNNSITTGSDIYRTAEEGDDNRSSTGIGTVSSSFEGFEATVNKTTIEASRTKNVTLVIPDEEDDENDDDDVIIVLSSSESEEEDEDEVSIDEPLPDKASPESRRQTDEFILNHSIKLDTASILDETDSLQENSLCQNDCDSIEAPASPLLDAIPDHFNDTFEEMEFMMRQGMKIMQQQKDQQEKSKQTEPASYSATRMQTTPLTQIDNSSNRFMKTNQNLATCKQTLFSHSPSSTSSAHKPLLTPTSASSWGNFKKPISRPPPAPKSAKKFDHIVSPIGAYIKKTPQTALQARIFCPNQNLIDVLNSKRDNRESVMSSKENFHQSQSVDPSTYSSSLPRKGVISSRGAHVLDERNAVRIPGGEKMHKLLNNSPTMVIRHEGRLKYERVAQLTDNSVADDSLADLSLVSGDVSVRVLKDVKRF
ncbi:probable serine/threonine-protein kinase mps1 isoform X2 [Toxorhynchites rutilus septentrionalis]|nr:probable serine/threonine-protein kinase mps1 isoform X2 [Toxorhynchites rutilus septentrionalis]